MAVNLSHGTKPAQGLADYDLCAGEHYRMAQEAFCAWQRELLDRLMALWLFPPFRESPPHWDDTQ